MFIYACGWEEAAGCKAGKLSKPQPTKAKNTSINLSISWKLNEMNKPTIDFKIIEILCHAQYCKLLKNGVKRDKIRDQQAIYFITVATLQ